MSWVQREEREERGCGAREKKRKRERKRIEKTRARRDLQARPSLSFLQLHFAPRFAPTRPALSSRAGESDVLRRSGARRELFDGAEIVHFDAARIASSFFFSLHRRRRRRPSPSSASRRDRCNFFSRLFFRFSPSAVPAFPCAASPFNGRPSISLHSKEQREITFRKTKRARNMFPFRFLFAPMLISPSPRRQT